MSYVENARKLLATENPDYKGFFTLGVFMSLVELSDKDEPDQFITRENLEKKVKENFPTSPTSNYAIINQYFSNNKIDKPIFKEYEFKVENSGDIFNSENHAEEGRKKTDFRVKGGESRIEELKEFFFENNAETNETIKSRILNVYKANIESWREERNINNSKSSKKTGKEYMADTALNTILYGPPGTGKTYSTIEKSVQIIEGDRYQEREDRKTLKDVFDKLLSDNKIGFTTFHPSYSYEDFVIGYKPKNVPGPNNTIQISYEPTAGIFYNMCKLASDKPDEKFVLIIDEINRGNLSSIFGELMTLIEDSKRIGENEEIRLALPLKLNPKEACEKEASDKKASEKEASDKATSDFVKDGKFGVPNNLYILGTMNTADRSAALMDVALRRRFVFEYMPPNYKILDFNVKKDANNVHIGTLLENLNNLIEKQRDRDHTIGHASFIKLKDKKEPTLLRHIFKQSILPLLEEYFYEDWKGLKEILPDLITENDGVYRWADCLEMNTDIDIFLTALSKMAN